jgi:hypothetical protein
MACTSTGPQPPAWTVLRTSRGFVAVLDEWMVVAQNGDRLPDSGIVTGVALYYKLEPVGGGGLYDFEAEGELWNEWVPFLVPTRPQYSELRSYGIEGTTLVVAFEDSVGPRPDMVFPHEAPLKFDLEITPVENGTLDFVLGGMHTVFPAVRVWDTVTIDIQSQNKPDTTLTVTYPISLWTFDFAGPSTYDYRSTHFDIFFETDAPLMKVGLGDQAAGDMIKYDLDHSLPAGVEYVQSHMTVRARY